MQKQLIHVRHFPHGKQGATVLLGTVMREVRKRKLYVPINSGCESPRMVWREFQLVSICGVDFVVATRQDDFGDHKAGDLIVSLAQDDKIPHDLRKAQP